MRLAPHGFELLGHDPELGGYGCDQRMITPELAGILPFDPGRFLVRSVR